MIKLPDILPPPAEIPTTIPINAKWLAGEGAGSWFVIQKTEKSGQYKITRFSPEGILECEEMFESDERFDPEKEYSINYPSYCSKVTVNQGNLSIEFKAIYRKKSE